MMIKKNPYGVLTVIEPKSYGNWTVLMVSESRVVTDFQLYIVNNP